MVELSERNILLFLVVLFLLYLFMSNCGCRVEGLTGELYDDLSEANIEDRVYDEGFNFFQLISDNLTPTSEEEFPTGFIPSPPIPTDKIATLVPGSSPSPTHSVPSESSEDFKKNKPYIKPDCSKGTLNNLPCWYGNSHDWGIFNISKNKKFVNDFLPPYVGGENGDINKCYEVSLPSISHLGFTAQKYMNKQIAPDGKNKLEAGLCRDRSGGNYNIFEKDGYLDLRNGPAGGLAKYLPYTVFQDRMGRDEEEINPYMLNGDCSLITSETYSDVAESEILCNSSVNNESHNCYWDTGENTCKTRNIKSILTKDECKDQKCNNKGYCEDGYEKKNIDDITCKNCFCSTGDNCENPLGNKVILNNNTCGKPTCKGKTLGTCQKGFRCGTKGQKATSGWDNFGFLGMAATVAVDMVEDERMCLPL